ncbi:hypothetical protein GF337_19300 [candidate division KSB1 bacterium]|nr:hypothetical protein [candidate division KSB1 bacterium]
MHISKSIDISHKTLSGLPRTLLMTLKARAEENERANRIIHDPISAEWFRRMNPDDETERSINVMYSPVFQLASAIRSQIYDSIAKGFFSSHDSPAIVELGAGVSTRYYRVPLQSCRWYELDLPEAIEFRQLLETKNANHHYLPYSMDDPTWVEALDNLLPQNILFIAEGVLFFLPPETVNRLFQLLHTSFRGAAFAFDVISSSFSPKARDRFTANDAPMQWLIRDESELEDFDIDIRDMTVLTHRYLPRWEELGFNVRKLLNTRGNILFNSTVV